MTEEKEAIIIDGIEIDEKIGRAIMYRVIADEKMNLRTKNKSNSDMVNIHIETIKAEIKKISL